MALVMRARNSVVLAKVETTAGTDAAPVAGTDEVLVENLSISFNANNIQTHEVTGGLDSLDDIVGGLNGQISFDVYLKGSGTPGTAPEFGKLLKACQFSEIVTAAAVGAPTAISAGTTTTATLAAPFAATAQLYRYMPLMISGAPSSALSFISDYTVGRVATLTDTLGAALTTSALVQVPVNVLYLPSSGAQTYLTQYVYMDQLLWKFVGCCGTVKFDFSSGQAVKMSFTFSGLFVSKTTASAPAAANLNYQTTRPVSWRGGVGGAFTLGSNLISGKQMTLDVGNTVVFPDDPNAQDGYGIPIITERRTTGQLNVNEALIATRDLMTDFRAGTKRSLHARGGTVAGNRWACTMGANQILSDQPSNDSGKLMAQNQFKTAIADGGMGLCFY
ncbi:phage tail tube protein [Nitrospirillum iridis]|uniref:Uncharacterized protein n=1 Tax=Nitrospirillum iridis TaxID=765888 RepID=A0A7X0ECA5_9PROT|nr:phage tail tube protein [Nitrospirillum iridis]MBB6251428.1 hypothetical protein [Nitrospirillum iridis]